jgi:hypothetical protein
MLSINDRKLTALYRRCYHRCELRPVKILGDLIDVRCAPTADLALIRYVDDKLVRVNPFQKRSGSRGNSDTGELNR